jgi:hypothetical protein
MNGSGLLDNLLSLFRQSSYALPDPRPRAKMIELALGLLCSPKPKTYTSVLQWLGHEKEDWSWAYRLGSQTQWEPVDLFAPILYRAVQLSGPACQPVFSVQDDTLLRKTGRRIPGTTYARDPLSPAFHVNLVLGQRFLQTTLLVPTGGPERPWRSIPISFRHTPPLKAPRGATPQQKAAVKEARKYHNLCTIAAEELALLRTHLDETPGGAQRLLIDAVDGGYAKKSFLTHLPERTSVVFRLRKDARLHAYLPPLSRLGRRKYGPALPTPEQIRQDEQRPWQTVNLYVAGQVREVSFKVLEGACWPRGAGDRPMRLLVLKPAGYRLRKGSRLLYRQPAYLGVIGPSTMAVEDPIYIQSYIGRWEIEVNHHEEKDELGVGQAQVWNSQSVPRTPALEVCCYAALLLSSIVTFGDRRTEAFEPLPKWRKTVPQRPSLRDLIALTRREAKHYLDRPAATQPLAA